MKIALVAAPNFNPLFPQIGKPHVPLGLLCIAAVLEPAGATCEIIDPNLFAITGHIPPDERFEGELARQISLQKYDAVGFSTLANSYHSILKIVQELRKFDEDVPIILGGPQATHTDVATLKAFPEIDVIVRGEGEIVTLDLLKALAGDMAFEDVKGITYRKGKGIVRNVDAPLIESLNELPLPAYKLYPVRGMTAVSLDAGRGCPYKCNFCSTCIFWKRKFRQKSPKRIADEMFVLKHAFGVASVDFTHDLFTLDRKHTTELCSIIRRKKIGLPWRCSTRIDAVDKRLLKTMAAAGCKAVFYGVESGSPRMQAVIGKKFDVAFVKKTVLETADAGMDVVASFIIGFPEETIDDVAKTIEMAMDLLGASHRVTNSQIHLLAVTNETELWDKYQNELQYDGIQTDLVGGSLFYEKNPFVMQHPELFPGHYYVKTPNVSRSFLVDLYMFGYSANANLRWSLIYAARKAGGFFPIAQKWHQWSKENRIELDEKNAPFEIKDRSMLTLMERIVSIARFLKTDPAGMGWKDDVFETIFAHEAKMIVLRTKIVAEGKAGTAAKKGDVLEKVVYDRDPAAIVKSILRGGPKKIARKKTIIEYFFAGQGGQGPVIGSRKGKEHDTIGKRRNKVGDRGRRVPSLSRGRVHRKNKRGARRRRA